jgi:hypothetical protein
VKKLVGLAAIRPHLWLLIAVASIAFAFVITRAITKFGDGVAASKSTVHFDVDTAGDTRNLSNIRINLNDGNLQAIITLPAGADLVSTMILSDLRNDSSSKDSSLPCTYLDSPSTQELDFQYELPPWRDNLPGSAAIPLTKITVRPRSRPSSASNPPATKTYSFSCALNIKPFEESFVDRKLFFERDALLAAPANIPAEEIGVRVGVEPAGTSDLYLNGGSLKGVVYPDTERSLTRYESASATWRDEEHAQIRDIALLLIGTLLALAVACAIEWVRPYIDPRQ